MSIARILASCVLAFVSASSLAAAYPDHPIRLIVPNAPGSTADVVARVVADKLGKTLGQPLIVENLAGVAGILGTQQLVGAKPDGYTLAIVSSNHAINPSLHKKMPYNSVTDITPLSVLGTTPLVLVTAQDSRYRDVGALLAAARAQPGRINYGSSGTGSVLHLAGELLKSQAHVNLTHIPYRGGNALITDVMSGQIQIAFLAVPSVLGQIQGGKLRALAVSTSERLSVLPQVPTLAESGVPGYAYDAWIEFIGPAKLPADIIKRLQDAAIQTMHDPAVQKKLEPLGFVCQGKDAKQAGALLRADIVKSRELVKSAGIAPE